MSWADLVPPKASKGTQAMAEASLNMMDGRGRNTAGHILTIRPQAMEGAPTWLKAGLTVSVQIGGGDHAGHLRITPNGPFLLAKGMGRKQAASVRLRLAPLPGAMIAVRPMSPCICDWSDGWLEIEVPAWAKPAPKPVPLSERVQDPAAALREQARGARK